jgi:amidase
VPAGFGDDGLPTNAHLVAKPLGEDTLLQLAAQLETARPPDGRRPAL